MSQAPYGPTPAAWPTQGPPPGGGPSRLPTIIAIVIALIAVAVAVGAWFRPAPKAETAAPKVYSEQETADAKKAVCDAFEKTEQALNVNSQRAGTNPTDDLAVIANTRIAIHGAGTYLTQVLNSSPAAPSQLATSIRDLASRYQTMPLDQISGAEQAQLQSDYDSADSTVAKVAQECR